MEDDPLIFSFVTCMENQYQTRTYVENLLHTIVDDKTEGIRALKENILNSTSAKRMTYKEMNPDLSVHPVYVAKTSVNEHHRVAFTRFRVSAHSLAVEAGRWNRRGRGRLPLEERLCICGNIQTELHVAQHCTFTQHLRDTHNFSTISELFSDHFNDAERCCIIYKILDVYKS